MSGFVNNYYYGKAGRADYTPEQMPATRTKLFFEMLRIHFGGLCSINLLYLVFCLPAVIWTVINVFVLAQEGNMDAVMPLYLMIMIPCFGLMGLGSPGLMYVLRNWARDQHSFMFSDFKDNVKQNWKQGLACGLIGGALLFVGYVGFRFYGDMAAQSLLYVVPQMLVMVVVVLWWMMNMLVYTMMVTYDMKFSQLIRNSAIMVIARLPWALLVFAGSIAVPLVLLFFVPYGSAIVLVLYLVLGFSLSGLVFASFANSCFDKYLNPRIEGAEVGMGLRDPSLDDEDDDDMDDPNPVA